MAGSTIKDVARKAGVSIATVSRVINKADNVNPELRKKVLAVIKELDYKPNQLARGLKNDITNTIGIIISDISNPFFMGIAREIENKVQDEGYTLLMVSTHDEPNKEYKYLKLLYEKRVDGIVISSTGKNEEYLNQIKSQVPVVLIDRRPENYRFDTVYVDKVEATNKMVNYLIENGHQKIAMISGPKELITNLDRFFGYTKAFYESGIELNNNLLLFGDFSEEFGRLAFRQLLESEQKPTAVISGSEIITKGILLEAKNMGVMIPEDISLISYGNIVMSELISPKIAYMDTLSRDIGRAAGDILLQRIKKPEKEIEEVILKAELFIGESIYKIK